MSKIKKNLSSTMSIKVDQINTYLGAEVTGINLSKTLKNKEVSALEANLSEYGVLIFRDQQMTGEQLMSLGKNFCAKCYLVLCNFCTKNLFFGDERILGSYLSRMMPMLFAILCLNYYKIQYINKLAILILILSDISRIEMTMFPLPYIRYCTVKCII